MIDKPKVEAEVAEKKPPRISPVAMRVKQARARGVPLIAIETPDPRDTMIGISRMYDLAKDKPIVFQWNMCSGIEVTDPARCFPVLMTMFKMMLGDEFEAPEPENASQKIAFANQVKAATMSPGACLDFLAASNPNCVWFMSNLNWFLENEGVRQSIWNLRDKLKSLGSTLIMMGSTFTLPAELKSDVLTLKHPLPTDEEIEEIVKLTWDDAFTNLPESEKPVIADVPAVVDALTGLNAFGVE